MNSLKLKFKLEVLHKLNKYSISEDFNTSKTFDGALKSKNKPSSAKQSVRSSKIISSTEFEGLPNFEKETSKMDLEEKDELTSYMKNMDYSSLCSIFSIIQNKLFYKKIKSKMGLEILKNYFKEILKMKTEINSNNYFINFQDNLVLSDECELYYYFKDILNITELEVIEIYELFKFNEFFSFTEKTFIILIYLLAANECGSLEDYFQTVSDDLFIVLSGSEKVINLNRMKDIGRILGFNERVMSKISTGIGLEINSAIDSNKFKEFYTILAKQYDEHNKIQSSVMQITTNKKQTKVNNTGCMSKACNIL